jgi:hypothetical protein
LKNLDGHTAESLLTHLYSAFDICEDDTPEIIYDWVHKGLQVEGTIRGLHDPEECVQCNVCQKWVDKLPRHRHNESKKEGGGHAKAIAEKLPKH